MSRRKISPGCFRSRNIFSAAARESVRQKSVPGECKSCSAEMRPGRGGHPKEERDGAGADPRDCEPGAVYVNAATLLEINFRHGLLSLPRSSSSVTCATCGKYLANRFN